MNWFKLLWAGFYTFAMMYLVYSSASLYREMAERYGEESREKMTSPERMKEARIYAEIYRTFSMTLDKMLLLSIAIISSAISAFSAIQSSADRRIRALEEELKQLRTLVSGSRPQDV